MTHSILNDLRVYRSDLGQKPDPGSTGRNAEAKQLTSLFTDHRGYSFVRLGDFDVAYLLDAEDHGSADLFPREADVNGTQGTGSPGLIAAQSPRLRAALENADYLDYHERLWSDGTMLERLALRRAPGTTRNPDRATSYILPTWLEQEFKSYCRNRRVLFCGAEAPLLEELLKQPEFRRSAADIWPEHTEAFFLRPREDGRNLASNLDAIKGDLADAIARQKIDTLFLSLGGGAKILCCELARELGICAVDFGAFMRSLTYSGSDGNRSSRSTHTVFLFRVPFDLHMTALERAFPDLAAEALLAKAHAQLLLEIQEKEPGWSHAAGEYDFSTENLKHFRAAFAAYKRRYRHLFDKDELTQKERISFLHFCGKHRLTWEGRFFYAWFSLKSALTSLLRRSLRTAN